jgi:non-specific serine/threonine protein kinase
MKAPENLEFFITSHYEETIQKGLSLYADHKEVIVIIEKKRKKYLLDVPSETGKGSYDVTLNVLTNDIEDECGCKAHDRYAECKHGVAAALHLLAKEHGYTTNQLEELAEEDDMDLYDMDDEEDMFIGNTYGETVDKKNLPLKKQAPLVLPATNQQWKLFTQTGSLDHNKLSILSGYYWPLQNLFKKLTQAGFDEKEKHWVFNFEESKTKIFVPELKYNSGDTYYYKCTCNDTNAYTMCRHVRTAFDLLLNKHGGNYFLQFKNWDIEKNKLLQPYGLTITDEDVKFFKFAVTYNGVLNMEVPPGYIQTGDKEQLKKLHLSLKRQNSSTGQSLLRPGVPPGTIIDFETGFVLNLKSQRLQLGFELEPAKVYHKNGRKDIKKLALNNAATLPLLKELNDELYNRLYQLRDEQLLGYLKTKGFTTAGSYANPWNYLTGGAGLALQQHYIKCLQQIWPFLAESTNTFLLTQGTFSSLNCKPVSISKEPFELSFNVTTDEKFISIWLRPAINSIDIMNVDETQVYFSFIFNVNNVLHIIKNEADIDVMKQFANGFIKIPINQKLEALQSIIAPLQERYVVTLPEGFKIKSIAVEPQPHVLLKEFNNQFLMLQPEFLYDDILVEYTTNPENIVTTLPDSSLQMIERDATKEKHFFELFRPLHHSFNNQRQNDFFFVHFNEVMKGNWFLNTVHYLQENNIVVKGMEELKRFRYNTNKPKWEMKTGSGIDWFDLQVTISFGDQQVPLKDIRKAIMGKQNIVVLGDGTFGVLPEEWLQQYSVLIKMGDEQKDGTLRVSKLHFTLIDDLHNQIDDEEILKEIEVKKQKLRNIENIQIIKHSKGIKATLRPYQLSGFQWLQTLDELRWGGCLADDMGLGKTLQAITFLQHLKEKYKGSTHLVVCPTSLIYNWESELKKFAPKIKYHIYYGSSREFTDEHFENYDVIITSYGLVRNDMEALIKFEWYYIILDESQAIKNPDAQTTKAVQLLKSKNRLAMSGTPVQNNTFDLYAQFHFLNPGLLGNKEFYKTEFANPIDKHNDAEASKQLRKIVYPFLLRRTKEQVAKDLPDKTETILWCQMAKEQRGVYEDYKNYYRTMLMKKIEEEGMAKASIYVLEGLLRLRQICDSPLLVKDKEVTTTQSIKIEELLREVEENTGSHKLLVFSQFTEMLQLIKTALQQKNISFAYLDGSTPAVKRKEAVDNFQNDTSIKVFLISLKAGGVGLNLTAADYVYIVDPWWNPAAEQQAIDRTHRIGQTQKIFAYKMICKDTVEEKIVQLQQRKKQLANELVTEDAGFIKKLSKDDVAFLFT